MIDLFSWLHGTFANPLKCSGFVKSAIGYLPPVKHMSHQMIYHSFERLKISKIGEKIGYRIGGRISDRIGQNSVKSEHFRCHTAGLSNTIKNKTIFHSFEYKNQVEYDNIQCCHLIALNK